MRIASDLKTRENRILKLRFPRLAIRCKHSDTAKLRKGLHPKSLAIGIAHAKFGHRENHLGIEIIPQVVWIG